MRRARRRRGRHARAVTGGPATALLPVLASRRLRVTLGCTAGLGFVLTAAFAAAGSGRVPRAAAVNLSTGRPAPAPVPVAVTPAAERAGDAPAMAYYRARDKADAPHVREIVWTGPMLRVYTDLPGSDADSATAITLCETAAAYLRSLGRVPEVFVHADRSAGYPVLANKMDARDDCRLNSVP